MRVTTIFHVGMGKTGTTSLQRALAASGEVLAAQKARYLGMWFERLGPGHEGFVGLRGLGQADAATQRALAARLAADLVAEADAEGTATFVHSNESIFERGKALTPFFTRLAEEVDLRILVYLRPPREWLPSAFAQWGVLHKTQVGPVPAFAELAPKLIRTYDAIRAWQEAFAPALTVRPFGAGTEIVADFTAATGIALAPEPTRHQSRPEPVEMLLRGLFNDRFRPPVLPNEFNAAVLKGTQSPLPSVARMAALLEDHAGMEEIIAARRDTFAFIEAEFGIAMLSAPPSDPPSDPSPGADPPDHDGPAGGAAPGSDGRDRLLDALVELTLAQSIRIRRLESAVDALEKSLAERS
ncbi:hypothetical protein DLJ53_32045 [Acuticoccus sediminis]|uniref:Sulfotransferase family protein n=1 Tax=Acuticoccus sediminis TaxID=2184697 RepID=A0A8B2NKR3_9HYPH|nr:hypothetical protein [Acuticoccus sediminis]RAH96543.1 hypothetical protein DLJ53_32045 [Acuticoccus sediminis]